MKNHNDVILRWSIGSQNTQTLSSYKEDKKYIDYVWLAKLSVLSFQRWFQGARFVLLYNGNNIDEFVKLWDNTKIDLLYDVEIINQVQHIKNGTYTNPYHFFPIGVWWKWIPFRLDINKHEIAVDTDILCVSEPLSWYDWIEGETDIVVAPERFETIRVNTCGDLCKHPFLIGKKPANCGIVGQRKNRNHEKRFFEITKEVRFGYTHDSMFITEQGVVNLWIYSLLEEGVSHTILDFKRNAWVRDFIYWVKNDINVETVHAVSWSKEVIRKLGQFFEKHIMNDDLHDTISRSRFMLEIMKESSSMRDPHRTLILQQTQLGFGPTEYSLVNR